MADIIHVERGSVPWEPAHDAHLVKEYRCHEIPLSGVIEQHGVRYHFFCASGADASANLWVYLHLSSQDEDALDAATFESYLTAVGFTGPAVMALAIDDLGIVAAHVMDELTAEGIEEGSTALVEALKKYVDAATEAAAYLVAAS